MANPSSLAKVSNTVAYVSLEINDSWITLLYGIAENSSQNLAQAGDTPDRDKIYWPPLQLSMALIRTVLECIE